MAYPSYQDEDPGQRPARARDRRTNVVAASAFGALAVASGLVSLILLTGTAAAEPTVIPTHTPTADAFDGNAVFC